MEPSTPPPPEPATPPDEPITPEQIEEGKVMAAVAYGLTLLLALPMGLLPMVMRDNRYSLYHGKQAFMAWIVAAVLYAAGIPLMLLCGIGIISLLAGLVCHLLFNIMGLVFALQGKVQPLPLIGAWAEKWFRGVRVKA